MKHRDNFNHSGVNSPMGESTHSYDTDNCSTHTMEWLHISDAAIRIEAILSGQAIIIPLDGLSHVYAPTHTVAVQPKAAETAFHHHRVIPLPHTVIFVKHTFKYRRESRSKRVVRITQEMIVYSFDKLTGAFNDEDGWCSLHRRTRWSACRHMEPTTAQVVGPLIMC